MRLSLPQAILAVLFLGVSFAYGYVVAKREIFPHGLIVSVRRAIEGGAGDEPADEPAAPGAVKTFMDNGWWLPVDPEEEEDERFAQLAAMGYAQAYEEAGESAPHGVIVHDAERSQPGHNLILSAHEPTAILADMQGETLHQWSFSFDDVPKPAGYEPPGTFGARCFRRVRLLENGELLAIYERMGLVKLDRDSNLVWGLAGLYHHDLDVTPDGTIHVLTHETGVVPRIHPTRRTFEDFVTRVSADGEVLGRFSLLEALEDSPYASLLYLADEANEDIFHTNTITVLDGSQAHLSPHFAAGMLLVSLWGLDTIAIVDPDQERVVWALNGMWHRQHEPLLLENGHMLLFDNMGHGGRSKVIEFEPFTQRIVWAFEGDDENDFYSELCGSNQRLSNGNTLITESLRGRAFEVTPEGQTVWYWSTPYRVTKTVDGETKSGIAVLMEMTRLEPDVPLHWLN